LLKGSDPSPVNKEKQFSYVSSKIIITNFVK